MQKGVPDEMICMKKMFRSTSVTHPVSGYPLHWITRAASPQVEMIRDFYCDSTIDPDSCCRTSLLIRFNTQIDFKIRECIWEGFTENSLMSSQKEIGLSFPHRTIVNISTNNSDKELVL